MQVMSEEVLEENPLHIPEESITAEYLPDIWLVFLLLFPNVNDGMEVFKVVNVQALFAFAVTTILLLPIAEEAFYRKGIIKLDNNFSLLITSVIGTLLYASEHSLKPLGFLIACIWSVPFTMSYI